MKQTKLQLVKRMAELVARNHSLSCANLAICSQLFTASLRAIRTAGALGEVISERDKLTTLLDEERDEVSRLRGLLADRIEYDRMRPPAVVTYCVDATDVEKRIHTALTKFHNCAARASVAVADEQRLRHLKTCLT